MSSPKVGRPAAGLGTQNLVVAVTPLRLPDDWQQCAVPLFRKHAANTLTELERLRLSWLLERFPGCRSNAYNARPGQTSPGP